MRYFLISFNITTADGQNGFGHIEFELEDFPSKTEIDRKVRDNSPIYLKGIVIINIFEFKNKHDYQSFNQ